MRKINHRVMMVGGSITQPNVPMDWTWRQLATEPFWQALQETGLKVSDVDLVACAYNDRSIPDSSIGPQVADALGLVPKPVMITSSACAGNGVASYVAWNAIASGRCDIVVSLGFARSDNYEAMESMNSQGNYVDFDCMMGLTYINYGAIRDDYYSRKYEVSLEDAGRWVYRCHWYARRNPLANAYNEPMPVLEELAADTPKVERDRQATNRGGIASCMIFAGEEIATQITGKLAVFDVACAYRSPYIGEFFHYPVAEFSALRVAAREAYDLAGIGVEEIDVAQTHDLTAYEGFRSIEGLGICSTGRAREYVAAGGISLEGRCPVNTYGGDAAFGHGSVGCDFQAGVIENFWQLRGGCGERQVQGAHIGINCSYGTHHLSDVVGVVQRGW